MEQWIHCNKCFAQPIEGIKFWFTSCGHIICGTCFGKLELTSEDGQQRHAKCAVCLMNARYLAINRHLRADIMDLFKPPKMLFQEYYQKLNSTLSFQAYHRERLALHRQEKYNKVVERLRIAEEELQKSSKKERSLFEEKNRLRMALQSEKTHNGNFNPLLNSSDHSVMLLHANSSSSNSINSTFVHHANISPAFLAGRNGILSKPLKPVVCATYSAVYPRPNTSTSNQFISPSASFYHHYTPSRSLSTGRITKGPILPPSLGIHN